MVQGANKITWATIYCLHISVSPHRKREIPIKQYSILFTWLRTSNRRPPQNQQWTIYKTKICLEWLSVSVFNFFFTLAYSLHSSSSCSSPPSSRSILRQPLMIGWECKFLLNAQHRNYCCGNPFIATFLPKAKVQILLLYLIGFCSYTGGN